VEKRTIGLYFSLIVSNQNGGNMAYSNTPSKNLRENTSTTRKKSPESREELLKALILERFADATRERFPLDSDKPE